MTEPARARQAFDHAVVLVSSLAQATREFTAAGFTVLAGGRHEGLPTENALVCFADGSYLELLATLEPATRAELRALRASDGWERHLRGVSAVARRFLPKLAGPDGVADWVLCTDSLARQAARLRANAIVASGPVAMGRERTGEEKLAWELLLPESALHPFWIADVMPRAHRVPSDSAATTHANGARGVRALRVRAPVVPMAALELGEVLGVAPSVRGDGVTVLDMGAWRVELVEGDPAGAMGLTLTGCAALTPEIAAYGIATDASPS